MKILLGYIFVLNVAAINNSFNFLNFFSVAVLGFEWEPIRLWYRHAINWATLHRGGLSSPVDSKSASRSDGPCSIPRIVTKKFSKGYSANYLLKT